MLRSDKFFYMTAQDRPVEKQPQIGCMTGILQLFNKNRVGCFHGNKRIAAASSSYGSGSPKSVPGLEYSGNDNGEVQPLRGAIDSPRGLRRILSFKDVVTDSIQRDQGSDLPVKKYDKLEESLQQCMSPDLRKRRSHRRVSSPESIEISSGSSPKLVDNGDVIEPPRSWVESRESTSSSFFPIRERPRYSCDGREISRKPFPLDDRNAYRSSSMNAMESPRFSVETSIKRPPNVVARLMGLDEMPDSVPLTNISSPRPAMRVETPKQSLSEAMLKAQDKSSSIEGINNFQGLEVVENTFRTESNSMVETPRPQLQPEISRLPLQPAQQNDLLQALFADYENNRKVNLEDCDSDLQALEKILEEIKMKRSLRSISTSSRSGDEDLGGRLENKSTCSTPEKGDSILSHRYGGGSSGGSLTKPRAAKKKCIVVDQKSSNIVRGKSVTRSLNLSKDVSPRRSRLLASKTFDEKSNASAPLAQQPSNHYSLTANEILPSQKLKSPNVVPKDQRKKSGTEIKMEKKNMNKSETKNGRHCKCNLQNPKMKKRLEVRPESKRLTSKSSSNCKAQQRTADKSCIQKDIISITEEPYEKEVEVLLEFTAEHPSQVPTELSPVSVLERLLRKEGISPRLLNKSALNFEDSRKSEEHVVLSRKANNQHQSACMEPCSIDSADKTFQRQKDLASSVSCIEYRKNSCKLPEFNYVAELFEASGLLQKNREEDRDIFMHFYSPAGFSIDLQIFYDLEKKFKTLNGGYRNRMHRRLIFDTVNEILKNKSAVPPYIRPPQKHPGGYGDAKLSAGDLLRQVVVGMERLSGSEWEDIMDGVCEIGNKDVELGDVVLGLEKSIFRDLMDEMVFDLIF